jgi:hypothetical protein
MALFDDLITEEQETAKAFAKEHKLDLELAAVIIRSSDEQAKRLEALKVLRAAVKPKAPAKEAKRATLEAKVKELQAGYDKAVEANNIQLQISFKNRLQRAVNDLKAVA